MERRHKIFFVEDLYLLQVGMIANNGNKEVKREDEFYLVAFKKKDGDYYEVFSEVKILQRPNGKFYTPYIIEVEELKIYVEDKMVNEKEIFKFLLEKNATKSFS